MEEIANIDHGSVQELFDREEDFSVWLAENIREYIGKGVLGVDFDDHKYETEYSVPDSRNADILLNISRTKHQVVIENQFGSADFDHFGRLQFYRYHTDSDIAILIARDFTSAFQSMIRDANRRSDQARYFAVSMHSIRVDNSKPAIQFNHRTGRSSGGI